MERKHFPRKILYLSCALLAVLICGTILFSINNSEHENARTSTDKNSSQRQRYLKEIEVMQALCDYDKDNIEDVTVHVETSDLEITSANIFVICKDKMIDSAEQDQIKAIALECLNLDSQNVNIEYGDLKGDR